MLLKYPIIFAMEMHHTNARINGSSGDSIFNCRFFWGPGCCGRRVLPTFISISSRKQLLPGGRPVWSSCCWRILSSAAVDSRKNSAQSGIISPRDEMDDALYTEEQLAGAIGKPRATVTEALSLTNLPVENKV